MRKGLLCPAGAIFVLMGSFTVCFGQEDVFSPATAESFLEAAIDLYSTPDAGTPQARQAMALLDAISAVEPKSEFILPYAVQLAWKFPQVDFSNTIQSLLVKYSANQADLEVVRLAIQYVVDRLDVREQRENYYMHMLKLIGMRNKALGSELSTQLGLLAAERADQETAEAYLMQAYNANVYNKVAFEALIGSSSKPMPADLYIRHLRTMMSENPYDIEAAFAFANEAYAMGLYEIAANGFEYCSSLFKELHPGETMPFAIYRPWALSCLNDERKLNECSKLAQMARNNGRFDIVIESIAAAAAAKMGNNAQAEEILNTTASKAIEIFAQTSGARTIKAQDIAWFYCFAQPDPQKALEWANKANSSEPNSAPVSALLAYALVMNGQAEVAGQVATPIAETSQAAGLARGMSLMATDANAGLTSIKSAIAMNAGTLEAARGKAYLEEKGSLYVPATEIANLAKTLQAEFGERVVNEFVPAQDIFSAKLSAIGTDFSYGNTFSVNLAITNKSADPMVISDDGLFKGVVRVDAVVSGDIKESIPNLLVNKFRPSQPIAANQSMFIPLRLMTGRLRHLLLEHPQADLKVEFKAYLDPVVDANGNVRNGFAGMEPLNLNITQTGVNISGPYLQNRLNSLVKGQPGQKIKTAQLFAGLLLEYYNTAGKKVYQMRDIEPELLRSALVKCLEDDNWTVKAETSFSMAGLPLNYELQNALSANLADNYWPVRLTSLWLLGRNSDEAFKKVLNWTAANDPSSHVVEMAVALGGEAPKKPETQKLAPSQAPRQSTITEVPAQEAPAEKTPAVTEEANDIKTQAQPEPNLPTESTPATDANIAAEPNVAQEANEPEIGGLSVADMLKAAEPNSDSNGL